MKSEIFFKTPEKIISQAGGSVISSDGKVSILFPQNAVNEDISVSIDPVANVISLDTNSVSDFYSISPYEINLQKPTVLRIAIPDSFVTNDLKDHHLHIGKINNANGNIDPLGGTIITVNNIPYLQSELSELGIYAAFKSDSLFQVDSVNTDMIVCQPRIFSPAGSVFEFPYTNILFDLSSSDNVTARIFNLAGKIKRTIRPENSLGPGKNVIVWDGKDFDGSIVQSGLYIVTLESSESVLRTTVGVLNR